MSKPDSATSTALATVDHSSALAMVHTPTEAEENLRALQEFIKRNMVTGEDYGVIPGTESTGKKVLLKPGAEKLAEIYGFAIDYEDARPPIERWEDDPFFAYFKKAVVRRRSDGRVMGTGIGSCNSREKKYAARWVFEREVPPGLDLTRLPRRDGTAKSNGRPYVQYRVPNPEIYDLVNTIEKMAAKRAGVSAIISVTRSSGIFTQDIEDNPQAHGIRTNKPEATEAEYEEDGGDRMRAAPSANPPIRTIIVPDEVRRERARWAKDGGDENTERVLASSPDANDRAMVFEWRIGQAKDLPTLASVATDITADPHEEMRGHMLGMAEKRRAEMAEGGRA